MIIKDAVNYLSGGYLFQEQSYTCGQTLIQELSQYPSCKAVIEAAQRALQQQNLKPLQVSIEPTQSGFDAEQHFNIIRIKPDLSPAKQRTLAIFELTNVIQHKKHMRVWELAVKGTYKTAEEYTRASEFLEFNGLKCANFVSHMMNKENRRFFRPSYCDNVWKNVETMEFNHYYTAYLSENHKDYYRKDWNRINEFYKVTNIPRTTNRNQQPSDKTL